MKTKKINTWLLAAVATVTSFAACTTDDFDYYGELSPVNFSASTEEAFSGSIGTRLVLKDSNADISAVYNRNYNFIKWNNGDSVYIWCKNAKSGHKNASYVTQFDTIHKKTAGSCVLGRVDNSQYIQWADSTNVHTFCAIYPAKAVTKSHEDADEMKFTVTMPSEYDSTSIAALKTPPMYARHKQSWAENTALNFRPAFTMIVVSFSIRVNDDFSLYGVSVEIADADDVKKNIVGTFEGTMSPTSTDSIPTYTATSTSSTKLTRTFTKSPKKFTHTSEDYQHEMQFPIILTSPLATTDKIIIKLYINSDLNKGFRSVTKVGDLKLRQSSYNSDLGKYDWSWGTAVSSVSNGSVINIPLILENGNMTLIYSFGNGVEDGGSIYW